MHVDAIQIQYPQADYLLKKPGDILNWIPHTFAAKS